MKTTGSSTSSLLLQPQASVCFSDFYNILLVVAGAFILGVMKTEEDSSVSSYFIQSARYPLFPAPTR